MESPFKLALPPKPTYRIGEVAAALGVHTGTVRGWIDDGTLAGLRIGSQRRIALAALHGFVKKYEREPT